MCDVIVHVNDYFAHLSHSVNFLEGARLIPRASPGQHEISPVGGGVALKAVRERGFHIGRCRIIFADRDEVSAPLARVSGAGRAHHHVGGVTGRAHRGGAGGRVLFGQVNDGRGRLGRICRRRVAASDQCNGKGGASPSHPRIASRCRRSCRTVSAARSCFRRLPAGRS